MCEVCAVFGRGRHWTARATEVGALLPAIDIRAYRAERRTALRVINAVVAARGARASDWDGESYQVEVASGAAVKVDNLGEVWSALENLGVEPIDPLEAGFAEAGA